MRLTKTVTIGDRTITVSELRVADIRLLISMEKGLENMGLDEAIETVLPMVCDLSVEDFSSMGLSSLTELWDAVREVNAAFFDLARRAGLTETANQILAEIKNSIEQNLTDVSAGLSSGGTPAPQSTDGASS